MTAMLFGKDRGPIYSHYDMDRPGNVDPVVDYASHGWSQEDMAFLLAHKITPGHAEASDMMGASISAKQQDSASLRSFLQLLAPTSAQTGAGLDQTAANNSQQSASWSSQRRNARKTPAQNKAALAGIIIWFLFILISMLMSALGK
jgi:hypothetical protein